jgi:hypothetical protein
LLKSSPLSIRPAPAAEIPGARSPLFLPVSKHFHLNYPDGSKAHITVGEKNDMLLAGEIQETADKCTFKYIGKEIVLHAFADLRKILPGFETNLLCRFYPGIFVDRVVGFVFEEGHATHELLESPEAMALRLGIG